MRVRVFVRRVAVAGLAVSVVAGLGVADVWVAPPAAAKPPDAPAPQQPSGVDVAPGGGRKPLKPPKVDQRVLRRTWPAGDVNPGGQPVTAGRGKKSQVGVSPVRVGLPPDAPADLVPARVRVLPPEESRALVG